MITTFNNHEIHTPIIKFIILLCLIILAIITSPLALILWLFRFEGFVRDNKYSIDSQAFHRKKKP